jgi:ribonuclease HII
MDLVLQLLDAAPGAVAAVDEVGRGAVAGPVAVGAVHVTTATPPPPAGVFDSKLLTHARRVELLEPIRAWAPVAVGFASVEEIDTYSITGALRLAAWRALGALPPVSAILLDGSHDWCTPPQQLSFLDGPLTDMLPGVLPTVRTHVGADRLCTPVAAASVVAKVARDAAMAVLAAEFPEFGFEHNAGYLTAAHRDTLATQGRTRVHRAWSY